MPQLRIGISGWLYKPWRTTFYPPGLPHNRELPFAASMFNSIEINGTFYSLKRPSAFLKWYENTPDSFLFSVKASRYITHMRKLNNINAPLANFFAQGLLALGKKLGPFLWQFPPNFTFHPEKLAPFFEQLPRTHADAQKLASRHDSRMNGRAFLNLGGGAKPTTKLRHAIEIRHPSFNTPDFVALLRRHKIALVIADTAGKWPFLEDLTADFVYARLHGDEQLYASGYTPKALDTWAAKIRAWQKGSEAPNPQHASPTPPPKRASRDVFLYFDNDIKVRAPYDALALAQRTGGYLPPQLPTEPPPNLPGEARQHWPL